MGEASGGQRDRRVAWRTDFSRSEDVRLMWLGNVLRIPSQDEVAHQNQKFESTLAGLG